MSDSASHELSNPAASFPLLHSCNQRSVAWLLRSRAASHADHPFLIWAPFDQDAVTVTYGGFYAFVTALAAGMRSYGVEKGQYVLLHMDNCLEFLYTWHACAQLGAIVVTTNTRCSEDEVAYFAENCGAAVAFTQPRYLPMLRRAAGNVLFTVVTSHDSGVSQPVQNSDGVIQFEDLCVESEDFQPADIAPEDFLSVQYTSGTTSRPKGVVWTNANAVFAARSNAAVCTLAEHDIGHTFLPLYHTNALCYSHLATLWAGATLVIQPRFSASRYWNCVVEHQCTWGTQIPFALKALIGHSIPQQHGVTRWGLGAHNPSLIRDLTGIPCIGWFGMTETVALPIYSTLGLPGREMSMGQASPEYGVEVRTESGAQASWGESGRLWIKGIPGLSLFHSYLHNSDATSAAFDADGWFDTGDLVTATEDGFITFDGRSGDMMRVGAENVAESQIERVVMDVQGILEVAVVGRPDEMLDEVPVAFVEAPGVESEEARTLLGERIIDHCKDKLADFKVPREVIVVDQIPRVTLGKLDKKALRTQLAIQAENTYVS